jgi:ACS family glucarate transporter-like MFS transporter
MPDIATARPTHVRYAVLAVLFLLAVLTYLDRVCISLAAPSISAEMHLTPLQMGLVFSIFASAYALFEVPTGWLGDRLGARRVLFRVLTWWSLFTAATGMVRGFYTLLGVRFLFGVGEAGAYPNMTRAIAAWYPPARRGMALGTIWMGSRLGAAIAPPLVLFLMSRFGWRFTFQLLGAAGIVFALFWRTWYRDSPAQKRGVNPAEAALIGLGPAAQAGAVSWRQIFRSSNLWALNAMYFTLGFTYYFYISWFPTYLVKHRGVPVANLAVYASLPLVFSTIASISGGLVTDSFARRWGIRWGRRAVGMAGCGASACLLLTGLRMHNPTASILLVSLAAAASDFTLAASWSACADIGGSAVGAVSGVMNMIGNVGSSVSPALMGYLIQRTGNWDLTLYIASALNLAGILLWFRVDAASRLAVPVSIPCPANASF